MLRHLMLIEVLTIALLSSFSVAQTPVSTAAASSTSLSFASIVPSTISYIYIGCYNETTGDASAGSVRALAGGSMNASDSMTVELCLSICGSDTFAGLEYGRECWCSQYLNVDSVKLPDANCTFRCSGDEAEVCGGSLKLTLYQRKNNTSGSGTLKSDAARKVAKFWGYGTLSAVPLAVVVGMGLLGLCLGMIMT